MPSVKLYDMKAKEVGTLELSDALFNVEFKESVIHQAVVTRLANERQGTKSTLTRSEVRGGGALCSLSFVCKSCNYCLVNYRFIIFGIEQSVGEFKRAYFFCFHIV